MPHPDVSIAGAGIIGLSLALELHAKGAKVTVFDQGDALAEASTAAAGMLAAYDPENRRELLDLSKLSLGLYPGFLDQLFKLAGTVVPFHTSTTLQGLGTHRESIRSLPVLTSETLRLVLPQLQVAGQPFILLSEHSLDPRELGTALLSAVRSTSIKLHTRTPVRLARSGERQVEIHTDRETVFAAQFVDCTGAWAFTPTIPAHLRPVPRKGQMLAVELPPELPLHVVVRTPDIYIVPRTTDAPRARAIIGATVEDAGFDKTVHAEDLRRLRLLAAELLPPLAETRELESWAGLRPATGDSLPLIGQITSNHFVATGHYRNGIMQAPGTARVMSQLLAGESPAVDLAAFHPLRDLS